MEAASSPTKSPARRSARSAERPSRTQAFFSQAVLVSHSVLLLEAPQLLLQLLDLLVFQGFCLLDLGRRHQLIQRQVLPALLDQDQDQELFLLLLRILLDQDLLQLLSLTSLLLWLVHLDLLGLLEEVEEVLVVVLDRQQQEQPREVLGQEPLLSHLLLLQVLLDQVLLRQPLRIPLDQELVLLALWSRPQRKMVGAASKTLMTTFSQTTNEI